MVSKAPATMAGEAMDKKEAAGFVSVFCFLPPLLFQRK